MEKSLNEYKIGDEMLYGKITEIFSSGPNYIFYECNSDGQIAYQVLGYDENWAILLDNNLEEIFALIPNPKKRRRYLGRIAAAHHSTLHGNPEAGVKLLEKVRDTIINQYKVRSRLTYLLGSLSIVILNLIITVLINSIWETSIIEQWLLIWNIITFGSLGGFLSISFTFKKLQIDFEENLYIPILAGISRIFIAMISSIIVYSVIKADLLLGFVNESNNIYIFYAFGALSGFSESFVPNILKKIEKDD